MKVPSGRGYQPPARRVASNEFDPYMAMAAVSMRAPVIFPEVQEPVEPEPRSTIAPPEMEPPPVEESAAIVDLGEARKAREFDKHEELMSKLASVEETHETVSRLAKQFEAVNDGSVQSTISEGITSVSAAVQGLKSDLSASLRRSLQTQQEIVKGSIDSFKSMTQEQIGQVLSQREQEFGKMVETVLSFNKRIDSLEQTLRETQSLMKAPKRIVRDEKGRAIGSVVDPNLGG